MHRTPQQVTMRHDIRWAAPVQRKVQQQWQACQLSLPGNVVLDITEYDRDTKSPACQLPHCTRMQAVHHKRHPFWPICRHTSRLACISHACFSNQLLIALLPHTSPAAPEDFQLRQHCSTGLPPNSSHAKSYSHVSVMTCNKTDCSSMFSL